MRTARHTDVGSAVVPFQRCPGLLLTLDIAVDLAVVQIRAGVTWLVVPNVSGVDYGTKNLIRLVHQRIRHADVTEHLGQRKVLGREQISRDGTVLSVSVDLA